MQQSQRAKRDDTVQQVLVHDINASLSALQSAMEVIKDEWRSNPELVERILPLMTEKIGQLKAQLTNFKKHSP